MGKCTGCYLFGTVDFIYQNVLCCVLIEVSIDFPSVIFENGNLIKWKTLNHYLQL